jgi:hypothetical protein
MDSSRQLWSIAAALLIVLAQETVADERARIPNYVAGSKDRLEQLRELEAKRPEKHHEGGVQ